MSGRGNDNHMGTNHPREPFPLQITLTFRSPHNPIDVFPTSAAKITLRTVFAANREKKTVKGRTLCLPTYLPTDVTPRRPLFGYLYSQACWPSPAQGGGWYNPLGFSENNSRTDRPSVAKLRVGTYSLNYFRSFLKMSRPYLPWLLTCDLISKVMSSEMYVPYRFNAWNLRTSVFLLVIWTWIGVAKWHPWFTLTLWPFRGQPRSSEVNDL